MKNQERQEKANVHDILSKNKKLWLAAAVAGTVCGLALSTTQVSASTDQATDQQSDNNITKPAQQDKNHQIQLDQQDNQQQNSPQGEVQAQAKQPRARQADDENDGLTLKVNYPTYDPGSGSGQTVTFSAGGVAGQQTIQAGDKVTITIPVGIYKLGTVQSIPAEYGSTTYEQVGDNYVITDTFNAVPAQVFQQRIR